MFTVSRDPGGPWPEDTQIAEPLRSPLAEGLDRGRRNFAAMGEMFSAMIGLQWYVENINAGRASLGEAVRRRLEAVHELTGAQLSDPTRDVDWDDGISIRRDFDGDHRAWRLYQLADFDRRIEELAQKFPQHAERLRGMGSLQDDAKAIARDAKARLDAASANPDLHSPLVPALAGALVGAANDPWQWGATLIGGGAGTAATAGARVLQVMATEAAINGGIEGAMQIAGSKWKQQAGIEWDMESAAWQVGVAALFGSTFGGALQGGREYVRLRNRELTALGRGLDEAAEAEFGDLMGRAFAGALEEDDFRRLLDGELDDIMGGPLPEAAKAELRLMAEDDALDRDTIEAIADAYGIPQDNVAARQALADAAMRHAADPDNNWSPEMVAESIAMRIEEFGDDADLRWSPEAEEALTRQAGGQFPVETAGDALRLRDDGADIPFDPIAGRQIRPDAEPDYPGDLAAPGPVRAADDGEAPAADGAPGRDPWLPADWTEPRRDGAGRLAEIDALHFEDREGVMRKGTLLDAIEDARAGETMADLLEACRL